MTYLHAGYIMAGYLFGTSHNGREPTNLSTHEICLMVAPQYLFLTP